MSYAQAYIDDLNRSGRWYFTTGEARAALGVSGDGIRHALYRLQKKKLIAHPVRGFNVILKEKRYRNIGCLPAGIFIPGLMEHLGLDYYIGLLTAAKYHGAAHQAPQVFQVMVEKPRRPIRCGRVRVEFHVRKRLADIPVRMFETTSNVHRTSSAEATALDVVGYRLEVGGLYNVANIIKAMGGKIDPYLLVDVAGTAPVSWSQRLGYLMEFLGHADRTGPLKDYVRERANCVARLRPDLPLLPDYADDWQLNINDVVDPDF
ncbi:MAG: type IV toxin-antitoxin system AbiEi family antitoxin [Parvularculales bacterium]